MKCSTRSSGLRSDQCVYATAKQARVVSVHTLEMTWRENSMDILYEGTFKLGCYLTCFC